MHHVLPRGNTLSHLLIERGDQVNDWTFLDTPRRPKATVACRCECGAIMDVRAENILRGLSQRCRPCSARSAHTTHGASDAGGKHSADRLYRIWKAMKWRCNPKNGHDGGMYHTRGITVCDEWRHDYPAFRDWALANGYADHLTIDRIDGDAGYAPDNCRWATPVEQARNTRRNVRVTAFGEIKSVAEWAEDARCVPCERTLRRRLERGATPEIALTSAVGPCRAGGR